MLELTPTLDTSERAELMICEDTISAGIRSFKDVGAALVKIRDLRLYRETHPTFDAYCSEKWDLGRSQAYRLIDAAEVVANLSPIGDTPLPTNESQVRPLAKLEPEQQQEAWARAVETAPEGRVTAAHVERVVEEMTGPAQAEESDFPEVETNYTPTPAAAPLSVPVEVIEQPKQPSSNAQKALHSSASNEWYTPARYMEAVRAVMGGIDLDPASNTIANATVKATYYYSQADNGFSKPWRGRVFLNPPYGKDEGESNQARWSARLLERYRAGDVTEAILLVNATTDRSWFQPLWDYPICFTNHRIPFYTEDGEGAQPTHGNAFIYLGPHVDRFVEAFSSFGVIATRMA